MAKITELQRVLMQRDGLSAAEAAEQIRDCKDEMNERLANGEYPHDILEEWFGLEPDYIFDLL